MNQGKLEAVKQEMARVNVDILGFNKWKWTGMGEFNSDDHYIYYCGQKSLRRNGVAIIANKSLKCSTWMQSQKQQNGSYGPAIPLLGIHTEETWSERDTCTPMFIAALFIIARTWKQPRCPSADEWIKKLWYIYTMEYYPAIKKNSFESVLMRWMKLEPIIQSEVNQKDKDHYSILTHIYGI